MAMSPNSPKHSCNRLLVKRISLFTRIYAKTDGFLTLFLNDDFINTMS
jgi:hypothetical protein